MYDMAPEGRKRGLAMPESDRELASQFQFSLCTEKHEYLCCFSTYILLLLWLITDTKPTCGRIMVCWGSIVARSGRGETVFGWQSIRTPHHSMQAKKSKSCWFVVVDFTLKEDRSGLYPLLPHMEEKTKTKQNQKSGDEDVKIAKQKYRSRLHMHIQTWNKKVVGTQQHKQNRCRTSRGDTNAIDENN